MSVSKFSRFQLPRFRFVRDFEAFAIRETFVSIDQAFDMTNEARQRVDQRATDVADTTEILLTLTEAAERYQVSRTTLRNKLRDGLVEGAERSSDGTNAWMLPLGWLEANYDRTTPAATAPSAADRAPDALDQAIAERHRRELSEARHEAEISAVTLERDRLATELARLRSDLEAAQARQDRADADHRQELAGVLDQLAAANDRADTMRTEADQQRDRAEAAAIDAAERAAQLDATNSQLQAATDRAEAQASKINRMTDDLAEAQANARWSYRRRLRNRRT